MGPRDQLYSRHIYVLVHSVPYLTCWVVLSEKTRSELLLWQQLPRLRSQYLYGGAYRTLHKSRHGRKRLRVGRSRDDRPVGDRPRILLRVHEDHVGLRGSRIPAAGEKLLYLPWRRNGSAPARTGYPDRAHCGADTALSPPEIITNGARTQPRTCYCYLLRMLPGKRKQQDAEEEKTR